MPFVPRIETVSHDSALIDRVRAVAAESGRLALRVETDTPWTEPLEGSVRVVDLAHVTGRSAPAFAGGLGNAHLVLVMPSAAQQPCVRYHRYPRSALEALLDEALHHLPLVTETPGVLLLGDSPTIRRVRDQIASVAPYGDVSVLVSGETGTGKELAAQAIHLGSRRPGAFVALNCAAVPETLFESELFGAEPGAFTGARAARVGLLETAAQGTLFLDEIGEMPQILQAKLLRVLETRTFRRLGSNRDIALDARIVSATNRPLYAAGADGHCGVTCSIGWPGSRSSSRHCAPGWKTSSSWRQRSSPPSRAGTGAPRCASPRTPSTCCASTPGRATCASCARSSSNRRSSRAERSSTARRSCWPCAAPSVAPRMMHRRAAPSGSPPRRPAWFARRFATSSAS